MMPTEMDLSGYQPTSDLAQATTIPARWYVDPAMLALEKERVFWRTWQPVTRLECVAAAGQYIPVEVAGAQLVVARGQDGRLRAFSNVCRHRAALIASHAGQGGVLRCPYHGWSYALDGRLHAAPEFEGVRDWDPASVCLPQSPVEAWGPFVFVNVDGQAPPFAEVTGSIGEEIAAFGCPFDQLHYSARRDYVIHCNWKVYVDNYLEGYHLPAAHPSLFRELDYANYRVETFRWHSLQHAPIRPPRPGEHRHYRRPDAGRALYYWIFPNFMLNVYPDNLGSNIILPLGHDRTLTIFEWFTYPKDGRTVEIRPQTIQFSDEIQQEDIRICESVQKGLASGSYEKGRFSVKRENGVHHFHLLLWEALGGSAS